MLHSCKCPFISYSARVYFYVGKKAREKGEKKGGIKKCLMKTDLEISDGHLVIYRMNADVTKIRSLIIDIIDIANK